MNKYIEMKQFKSDLATVISKLNKVVIVVIMK